MNINSLGLILDIFGAILIFLFGISPNISREGHINLILEQEDTSEKEKAKKYDSYSRIGMYLLIAGFILQLISNHI